MYKKLKTEPTETILGVNNCALKQAFIFTDVFSEASAASCYELDSHSFATRDVIACLD
jgi:hypothetical protein